MKIMFVCTGNACRSAAAEAVLKKMIEDNGIKDVDVASCGTKVHGIMKRDEVMCHIAAEKGYHLSGMAVPATEDLLNDADRIIVMTEHHRDEVTRVLAYSHWDKIVRFNDYCFGDPSDMPDPNFQAEHVYRTCFDTIERGCQEIIRKLNNCSKVCGKAQY